MLELQTFAETISSANTMTAAQVAPAEDDLLCAARRVREAHPDLGIAKLLAQLKVDQPDWTVSEKRFRKSLQSVSESNGAAPVTSGEQNLEAETGLDSSINVAAIAPKVKAKMLPGRGKGLVAKEKMQQGEWIWQEEPWCLVTHPKVSIGVAYLYL